MAKNKTRAKQILAAPQEAALKSPPRFIKPMLVGDKKAIPEGAEWVHEIKHDGWRLQARIDNGKVTLRTRNGMDVTKEFTLVAEELSKLPLKNAIIDGEITAPRLGGLTSLSDLTLAMGNNRKFKNQNPFQYFVFDLMFLNGQDITGCPLVERKKKLERLLRKKPEHVKYVWHVKATPERLKEDIGGYRLEGVVSKLENSIYLSGRHVDWRKFKFRKRGWKKDYEHAPA